MSASYEVSSTYAGGMVKALRALSLLDDRVTSRLSEEQRAIVKSPWARGWWPGPVSEGIAQAAFEVHGAEAIERAGYETVFRSVGPIITPLISVIGAIFGLTPPTLFERMADLSSTSVKGVTLAWKSTGARGGDFIITYPTPLCGATEPLWRGACRYILQTARADGRIASSRVVDRTITLSVEWV
jgi:hypothetical protein